MTLMEQNPAGIRPVGIRADYLAGLNACFPNWGGDEKFDWALTRPVDGQAPDLLVVREDGKVAAGTAVSYRHIRVGKAKPIRVGIMTGSWTLPEARRRGLFERMIEASRDCTAARGGTLLLAFVTESNGSYRRLAAAGARQWATHYLSTRANNEPRVEASAVVIQTLAAKDIEVHRLLEAARSISPNVARFEYTAEDWAAQYLNRPNPTELVRLNDDGLAVLETQDGIYRILALYCPTDAGFPDTLQALAARAATRGGGLMFFTTAFEQARFAEIMGMKRQPGFLMALDCDAQDTQAKRITEWDMQSGDRM